MQLENKSNFEACSLAHAVSMTSLMVAPLPEDPSLPGSVALKPEESKPTQPNPTPPWAGPRDSGAYRGRLVGNGRQHRKVVPQNEEPRRRRQAQEMAGRDHRL